MADLLPLVIVVFLAAGAIKGLIGVGLPTAAMGILTLFIEPRLAISLTLFPMIGSNFWQIYRGGHILRTAKRYWPFALCLFLSVGATVLITRAADDRLLLGVLGSVMIIYVALSLADRIPKLPDRFDRPAQVIFGLVSGVIGGLASAWAGPMAVYLSSRRVEKDEFVRATGFLIFAGCLPLMVGYAVLGFLTGPLAGWSLALLGPTLAGFWVGERLRRHLSGVGFARMVLLVFAILGLNLIRRAVFTG